MTFSRWIRAHQRSLLFAVLLLAAGGVFSLFQLPISLFPDVQFPRAVVEMSAGDRPAEQMATEVTTPVEEALRNVPGVRDVESKTNRGGAEISVSFDWGTDMVQSTLQMQAAIANILTSLPSNVTMQVRRMDPTQFPVIAYSLTSSSQSPTALYDLAQYRIRPMLSSIQGVATVAVLGGAQQELQVSVDPHRLAAAGLALSDVSRAIGASNLLMASGRIEDHDKLLLVVANHPVDSIDALKKVVLRSARGGMVHLGDIADVSNGVVPEWIRVNANGKPAVLLNVYQQPGANSVAIAKQIRIQLQAFQATLPASTHLSNWYDQSDLVVASASSVRDAILIGVVLAALTLFVFLRNVKITLIAVALVPVVMASTVLLLQVFGMGFNIMTLGGMAAAVGLVIDDAIVMIEHIVRRLQQPHSNADAPGARDVRTARETAEAAAHVRSPLSTRMLDAAWEFTRPLSGSSAATLVIFAPLAFLSGVTGAFFKALSITMASALFLSFLITWLAIPILCQRFLNQKDAAHKAPSAFAVKFDGGFRRLLARLIRQPLWLLVGVIPLLCAGSFAATQVGTGFMPTMDEGGFVIDYHTPPGTSLAETSRLMQQVESIIDHDPAVASYSLRTGTGLGGGLGEANKGDFFVRLTQDKRPPIDAIMSRLRTQIETQVPGVQLEMAQLMEDLIGDLTAVPQPVQIKIFSDDANALNDSATRVAAAIGKIPGIVDVADGINPAGDALQVDVRPDAAAAEGMDPQAVAQAVSDALAGVVSTHYDAGPKVVGVRVRVNGAGGLTETALGNLSVRAPDGHMFPLRRVAVLSVLTGQSEITRDNLKRMVGVTARIEGRDLGSTIADVQHVLQNKSLLPPNGYYTLGGLYQQQQIAFHGLMIVFGTAVALLFALLLFLYERIRIALAIVLMPLSAAGAVFVGLWITGIELNITAMMGMTMILGIVTEVAIFYVSELYALQLEHDMPFQQALVDAALNRLRPIAMTTIAAILALLPLAFALGQGSAMQQPLAVAIIAGLILQFPLVLLVLPVLLKLLLRSSPVRVPE
ncbi:efflux RND transporter permease subunit [Robbsia sp. KACC 23696]|uniref:efflux RND transporter permease subunit n=1 Tax=Robbsia sp. KACC 23696 TaxID=3149231 RepID=UPI00325BC6B0